MAAPQRIDRDGNLIPPGPAFGARRFPTETTEERRERLTSEVETDETSEAMQQILGEIEQAKADYGLEDEEGISTLEELDELVGRATWATKVAAEKVVADNPKSLAGQIQAQHDAAFTAAFNSDGEFDIEVPEPETKPGLILFDENASTRYYTDQAGNVYQVEKDEDKGSFEAEKVAEDERFERGLARAQARRREMGTRWLPTQEAWPLEQRELANELLELSKQFLPETQSDFLQR